MSTWEAYLCVLVCLGTIAGCGETRLPPGETKAAEAETPAAEAVTAETEAGVDLEIDLDFADEGAKPSSDAAFMLDRLRDAVKSVGPGWAVAQSPVTWSTLTVDVDESFSAETAAAVWAKWTEPVSALTLRSNLQIKSEIEQAVAAAIQKHGHVEREFESKGFRFVVTASDGTLPETRFVRISFKAE